ncbi:hypothetical protein GW17_00010189 [Ensete ventricosum]|nr:hypothetical protein GW17_00010189 [Ensete ventricosum]RZS03727.1 hypothetical protein BHM03_00033939 [Ensete ventricosum]
MDLPSKPRGSSPLGLFISSPISIPLLILLLLVAEGGAAPWEARKSGKFSVFSLFNLKGKSKFWTESVIRGGKDIVTYLAFSFIYCFIFSGNIANYLELSEVDSIYLPIPVNFVFIGFEGKGNHGEACLTQRSKFLRRYNE